MTEPKRRLAAILAADVVGYSRLMAEDEAATVAALDQARAVFQDHIGRNQGRVVDTAGDSVLAVFETAVGAVEAARAIQTQLADLNSQHAEDRRMLFRIGVHLGDIIEKEDGSVYGDGINVAARLESLCEPGAITVSGAVHDGIRGQVDIDYQFLGEQSVKNLPHPVRAYRVVAAGLARARKPAFARPILAATAAAVLASLAVVIWTVVDRGDPPSDDSAVTLDVARTDPVLALPTGPSIAVLPFRNMGDDPAQDYFAAGLSADISAQMSYEPDLKVIGGSATAQFKGDAVDARETGRRLGAAYVLKGSVRRDRETVRITAELLETEDGRQIWAQTYDRDLSAMSLFEIQDAITQQVVSTVADGYGIIPRLLRKHAKERATVELSSYECVLLAHEYFEKIMPKPHLRARDCLEGAVTRDPEYADAWGWLAILYAHEMAMGMNPLPNSFDRALAAAQQGVNADDANQMAWEGMAAAHYFRHERDKFVAAAEKAVAINPNDVSTIANIGYYYGTWGMWDTGLPLLRKAIELSPFDVFWYYAPFWSEAFHKGDYESALTYAHKMARPGNFWGHINYAATYAQLGQIDDARAEIEKLLELKPDIVDTLRENFRFWNFPEPFIESVIVALRKAGLAIPDETS